MYEFSWLLFYLLLHLGIAALTVPWLYWLGRSRWQPAPQLMLRCWTALIVLLFILPMLLLTLTSEGSLESQPLNSNVATLPFQAEPLAQLRYSEPATAEAAPEMTQRFALTPQLFYLLSPPVWLLLLLPLVCLAQGYRFYQSYRLSRRLWQQAQPVVLPLVLPATANGYPGLYQHPAISSAMLLGLRHPRILLPTQWLHSLSAEQLQHVIEHERMHWQRGDLMAFYLQQLAGIVCCCSPLWRMLSRQLTSYRELSCDAAVIAGLSQPYRYAQTLLDCNKKMVTAQPAIMAMPWQQQPLLARRISTVLQGSTGRITPVAALMLTTIAVMLLLTYGLTQHWQVAKLPKQHGQITLSQLGPLDELIRSIKQNDLPTVQQLIKKENLLNQAMPGEGTPLMVAVRYENTEVINVLLKAGADVNASSRGDGNALIIAVQRRNLALAQQLIAAGADVNAVVLADETALINASYLGDLAMVQYLVSVGARVNLKVEAPLLDGRELRSALSRAATDEIRTYLRAQGASL
ncbi:M56 family metallopeptidase [Arsukibacterium sp.]|uniref:M56 family metallopeptidase n=1 Tax=Arsukibacterium sp. TaxID=1977258 RepID=UPI00299E1BC3|nr:M56 family metallopeptidase [Arsukibacterium sp.]MDX1539464.1 M56 family metallopeptidase [Arsukibacterium sp.]